MSPLSISDSSSSTSGLDLTATIVTYRNSTAQLRSAIESLVHQAARVQLMLVDNAGEDRVASLAREVGACYLRAPGNLGFGKAHNLAHRQLRPLSPYHLVLNPDVHFGPEVVRSLLQVMNEHADVGVVMPKILYPDGSTQYLCKRLPTPWDLLMRRFAPPPARQLLRPAMDRYELRDRDYDQPMQPPTLSGCFLLLRNSVIDQVGLFDERFFMYMEDVDLVRRIWGVSRVLYYPDVSIIHGYEKGSYRNHQLAWQHVRSAVRYFRKWGWIRDAERDRLNIQNVSRRTS